jgi:hypothetical protein
MIYDLNNELDRNKLFSRLDALLKKSSIIELKEVKKIRTLSQNAYLHVCITLFAIEFGYDLENAKHILKSACPFMHEFRDEIKIVKQTRKLNTKELTDFIEWIREFSAMQGCYIPTPNEYITNKIQIDNSINSVKNFL